jgi:asparagine synthase (glutamine-hydrolysing)
MRAIRPDGEQPFHSSDGYVHAIVNGELYEADAAREQLRKDTGYVFKGKSDCEIVIALYQLHGTSFLKYLRGEFALCLYDSRTKTFLAARDRYGIKPLFYAQHNGSLLVAAEVKAFAPLGLEAEWDVQSLTERGYAHDQRSIFKGVSKVCQSVRTTCTQLLTPIQGQAGVLLYLQCFWSHRSPELLGYGVFRQGKFSLCLAKSSSL